jgi:hypothetical protein
MKRFIIAIVIIALSGCDAAITEEIENMPGMKSWTYVSDVKIAKDGTLIVSKTKALLFAPGDTLRTFNVK